MQMLKVLLIHISSIGCCNPLVIMLNNGNFGFPYSLLPRFPPLQSGAVFSTPTISTPAFLLLPCFQSPLPPMGGSKTQSVQNLNNDLQ